MLDKYNILLITSDSQRTDSLSCMGSPFAYSPHLDTLSEQGVLFTQAHSAAPVCMPARCSLMTGLHAPLHGCLENGLRPRDGLYFLTDALKEAGYINIMVGKTHFGPIPPSFDHQYVVKGEKNNHSNGFFSVDPGKSTLDEKFHLDSMIVDRTIESLDDIRKINKPFFAFCSILSPHSPVDPPGRWLTDTFLKEKIPIPRFKTNEWETMPPSIKEFCGLPGKNQKNAKYPDNIKEAEGNIADALSVDEIIAYNELYYRSTAFVDSLIGRLMEFLNSSGLRKNTLVIFTSDHGLQNYDHGFNDKHNYYDESLRVPFIMSLPGVLPENEKQEFASHVDLAPTILAAAGLDCQFANGFDLFTPLVNREELPRHFAAASLYGSLALVTKEWKLEYYYLDDKIHLFNRIADPGENYDLAEDPQYSDVNAFFCHALLLWRSGLTDSEGLKKSTNQGGPVAMRVIEKIHAGNGRDNEILIEKMLQKYSCNIAPKHSEEHYFS